MFKNCPVCKFEVDENSQICPQCGFRLIESTQQFAPIQVSQNSSKSDNNCQNVSKKTLDKKMSQNNGFSDSKNINSIRYYLLFLTGLQKGSKFVLSENEVNLGRDVNCDIFLSDTTVSRRHALIYFEKGVHIIKDLGSFNGVWVNNKNVFTKALVDGDIIQLGNFNFEYHAQ